MAATARLVTSLERGEKLFDYLGARGHAHVALSRRGSS